MKHQGAETEILKKLNEDIGPRIKEGDGFGFLARKLYNCLLSYAQRNGLDGVGRLPPGVDLKLSNDETTEYWWMPLSDLVKDAAVNSKATDVIKDTLKCLQTTLVIREIIQTNGRKAWDSDQMLGSVKIRNDANTPGNGRLWVGFKFASQEISRLVVEPATAYTLLSVFYQSELKTEAALVLYEICRQWSSKKMTPLKPWQDYAIRLCPRSPTAEYRYFKRDVLKRAVKEVTDITNLNVTLKETKTGSRIAGIQFLVDFKEQLALPTETIPKLDAEISAVTELMGRAHLTAADATKALQGPNADLVQATLALLDERIANKSSPIESPAAFFKKALKERWADSKAIVDREKEKRTAENKKLFDATKAQGDAALVEKMAAAKEAQDPHGPARERFLGLVAADREALITEYIATAAGGALGPLVKNLKSDLIAGKYKTVAAKQFFLWLAGRV